MKTAFIRHMFSDLPNFINKLWDCREIAIHYHNIPSTNPDDYPKNHGRYAIRRLNNYCKKGVIIAGKYKNTHPDKMIVGVIPEGSQIDIQTIDKDGESLYYKSVQLINAKEVSLAEYPLLAAIQPRGGAITGWPSATTVLNSIIFGNSTEPEVNLLSPGQLEVLCQEYLRKEGILKALLLPIGRNLLDIDIVGIQDSGHKVFAQVTQEGHKSRIERKLISLKQYRGQENELIFFGPESCKIVVGDVRYITINHVFDEMKFSQEPIYRQIIAALFNMNSSVQN